MQACTSGSTCTEAYSFAASSNSSNGYEIKIDFGALSTTGKNVIISAFDARVTPGVSTGTIASPPYPELKPFWAEMAYCERYYFSTYGNGVAPGTSTHTGIQGSGVSASGYGQLSFLFTVPMRATPTFSYWDGAGNASKTSYYYNGTWYDNVTTAGSAIPLTTATTGVFIYSGNTTGNTTAIQFTVSAEL